MPDENPIKIRGCDGQGAALDEIKRRIATPAWEYRLPGGAVVLVEDAAKFEAEFLASNKGKLYRRPQPDDWEEVRRG